VDGDVSTLNTQITTINSELNIPESSVEYCTVYPNGRIASPQSIAVTIPIYNPHEKTITITAAYVYNASGNATDIKSSTSVGTVTKTYATILSTFNNAYAGMLLRFVLAYS
jgi:uncharacterized membrane protein